MSLFSGVTEKPRRCTRRRREHALKYITSFFQFWYDFIVGDDWTIAAAVTLTLAVIILLAHAHVKLWWLLLVVVVAGLGASLWRAAQTA